MDFSGVIDMHIHTAPDIRQRPLDDIDIAMAAKKLGIRGIVLKCHVMSTVSRAIIAEKVCRGVKVFGGIVLNPQVGGLNHSAVEAAIQMGAKIVWLPTLFSSNHRKMHGKNDGIETVIDNKVVPALKNILDIIAKNNVVLATSHLSTKEIFVVVNEAQHRGIKKIVITHPEIGVVNMSINDQKALAESGVYFERCYAKPIGNGKYEKNLVTNLEAIDKVGYQSTIIATDSGQMENPLWDKAITEYFNFLENSGISQKELDIMAKYNPAKLLDL